MRRQRWDDDDGRVSQARRLFGGDFQGGMVRRLVVNAVTPIHSKDITRGNHHVLLRVHVRWPFVRHGRDPETGISATWHRTQILPRPFPTPRCALIADSEHVRATPAEFGDRPFYCCRCCCHRKPSTKKINNVRWTESDRVCASASISREKKGKEAYSKAGAEQREA